MTDLLTIAVDWGTLRDRLESGDLGGGMYAPTRETFDFVRNPESYHISDEIVFRDQRGKLINPLDAHEHLTPGTVFMVNASPRLCVLCSGL